MSATGLSFTISPAQTFPGMGGVLVPPGAPTQTVGIATSEATVTGIGILGTGCSQIENVTIDFEHTWVGDCALFIIAPSGEVLELSSQNGGSGDDYQVTVFSDFAPQFITAGFPPYNGTFRPEGRQQNTTPPFPNTNPLGTFTFQNTFDGVNADGDWTLMINDFVALDVGIINSWSITFSSGGGPEPEVTIGPDITICPGESAMLTASVLPSADTYSWNTGATSQTITVSPAVNTTYMVTVTNNGCIDADTIQVFIDPNAVTADAGPDVSICSGSTTDLHATGGGAGATYAWSDGQTGSDITVSPATTTTYTVTITDGACTGTDQVVVNVTPSPNAIAGNDITICEGQSTILVGTGGNQNNQYTWSTGQTGPSISVSPAVTTIYTLTVNINGCVDQDEVTVTVSPTPTVSAGPDEVLCLGESILLSATGSPGTYAWSDGQSGMDILVAPVISTTYIVTVTDNGCMATDAVFVQVIDVSANAGPDQVICEGGSAVLTASGGTGFLWSTGATTQSITVSPSTTTTYQVTVTQGVCEGSDDVTITVNAVPVATVTPDQEICEGESVQLIAAGGTTFLWSTGQSGAQIAVAPTGTTTYTVTVTQAGCSSTASTTVQVNPTPVVNTGNNETICEGESVALHADILGGSGSLLWSTGETTPDIIVFPINTSSYSVTVTSADGCSSTDAVSVTVNPYPAADAGQDVSICAGEQALLIASGGAGPGTYTWSTGQSGSSIQVSPPSDQSYTVTVTVNGCSSSDEINVFVFPEANADAGQDVSICAGDGPVTLTASGGGDYLWSTGQPFQVIDVNPQVTTTYFVTVTNADGCEDIDEVTVVVEPAPPANAGADMTICEGEQAELNASGGIDYFWSTLEGSSTIVVSPSATTTYTVTVTSAAGCTASDAVTVRINPLPNANAGPNVFIIPGDTTTLTASGGGQYLWSTGETTPSIAVSPDSTTLYTVTVTLNGCMAIDQVTVFVNQLPAVDLGNDLNICNGQSVILDATISGPFSLEYLWSNGATTPTTEVMPNVNTMFSVTVTDINTGFTTTDTILVSVLDIPIGEVQITGDTVFCTGSIVSYSASPVTNGEVFTWSAPSGATITSGQGTMVIQVDWGNVSSGNITLTVSNACGSLPTMIQAVLIETPPVITEDITGDFSPCDWVSTSYSINDVQDADLFSWTVTGGAIIESGQGTDSVVINWNNTAGGDVCVTASNDCGMSVAVCSTIVTTSVPVANAGTDTMYCGSSATLSATGTGSWTVIAGPGTASFADPSNPITQLSVDQPGQYVLSWTIDNNGCTATDEVIIDFFEIPRITGLEEDCNAINTGYIVSFDISGGTGPYSVNGMPIAGSTYTSAEIAAGIPYSYVVTDANGCAAVDLSGLLECNCSSFAGEMEVMSIDVCTDAIAIGEYLGGAGLDGNDTIAFALHDGTFPSGIIQWNSVPEFAFIPGMETGTTYFITAVVGNIAGGGIPDITDPCLASSEGVPVIFHDPPAVNAGVDREIGCDPALVSLSGLSDAALPEYQWSAFDGGVINGATNTTDISAIAPGGYILQVIDNLSGCSSFDTAFVTQHSLSLSGLEIGLIDPMCFRDCNGRIVLNGEVSWTYALDAITFESDTLIEGLCSGEYMISVKDSFGCIRDSVVQLFDPDPISVDLGPDVSVGAGETIDLIAQIDGNASTIEWSPIACSGCPELSLAPDESLVVSIEVSDDRGCFATDEVAINVILSTDIFVPSIFTPNGDDINDRLAVYANPAVVMIEKFEIFDRWGNLVFGDSNPGGAPIEAWDGTFQGQNLNPGVYVYYLVARLNDRQTIVQKGDITLLR